MNMRLTPDEVRQAIREWSLRRGVDTGNKNIMFAVVAGAVTATGILVAEVQDVELPVKDGPYR